MLPLGVASGYTSAVAWPAGADTPHVQRQVIQKESEMLTLSRRAILKLLGGLAAGAAVAGCRVEVEQPTEPAEEDEGEKAAAGAYKCSKCGYVYDPAKADPPTPFADLPDDWKCPKCGAAKAMYQPCG